MVKRAEDHRVQINENMKGGTGPTQVIRVMEEGEYESPLKLIGKLVLQPGSALGYHTHEGEEEIIHVLSGTARYIDGSEETLLRAGDSCICLSGHGHSIACASETEPLVVFAVINRL